MLNKNSKSKTVNRKLTILADIFEQMVAQAKAEAPVEACGILAGKDGKVEKIYKMTNVDASSDPTITKLKDEEQPVCNLKNSV